MAKNPRMKNWRDFPAWPSAPSDDAVAINVASTDQALATEGRGVYVSGAGDLNVTLTSGTTIKFVGLLAGAVYPFAIKTVIKTGTTCSGIILL